MQTYNTYLPIFMGFYCTSLEPDESYAIDCANETTMKELQFEDLNFNYKQYYEDVVTKCINFVSDKLKELGFNNKIELEGLVHPKEYNFANDSANIEIDIDLEGLLGYINENKQDFDQYIKEKYTSCSGFTSFHSNDGDDWAKEYILEKEGHRVGAILSFILFNEDEEIEGEMIQEVLEDVWLDYEIKESSI